MTSAAAIRHHLRFDVARLRAAACRLQAVDGDLRTLRARLEARARALAAEADGEPAPRLDAEEPEEVGLTALRVAQAQATAELARRATLGEVLRHADAFSLIATMAVARWIDTLVSSLPPANRVSSPHREAPGTALPADLERRAALAKGHIDAGRIAHRMLASLKRRAGLRSGCGQLVCAVVVAELAPADLQEYLDEQIEEGFVRALKARGVKEPADAMAAASAALREGARLLESMTARAAPAAEALLAQAAVVEERIESVMRREAEARRW